MIARRILRRYCCIDDLAAIRVRVYRLMIISVAVWMLAGSFSSILGQTNVSGRFFGIVRDRDTRAVISEATATFRNLRTGSLTTARSGSDGQFSYTPLSPDDYDIEVKADGYLPQTKRQTLTAMEPTPVEPVPFDLEKVSAVPVPTITPVGGPTPGPTAAATSPDSENIVLNTSRGGIFDIRALLGLPIGSTTLTRTFDELAFYVAGVYPPPLAIGNTVGPGVGSGVGTSGQFSVNGLRSRANNFTVDGSDNNDEDIGVRRQGFLSLVPQPIESVQEFQIITLLAPAQYGRNLGAQVNAVSRAGGNDFHGILFGLANADFLNARDHFDSVAGNSSFNLQGRRLSGGLVPVTLNGQPIQITNDAGRKDNFSLLQGGFAVGGPIVRNKMFFFGSGEYEHLDGTRERHFAVPTVEQRGILGSGAQGFFGRATQTASNTAQAETVFPIFPTTATGDAVFSLFPFPNDPNGIYGANTYTKALPIDGRGLILSGRVDWDLFRYNSHQQTFTARYNFTNDKRDLTDVAGALFSAIQPKVRTDNISTFLAGGITNSLSNEFRFSYGRTRLKFEELRDDFLQPVTSLGAGQDTRFLLNARIIANQTIPTCPGGQSPCLDTSLTFSPTVNYVSTGLLTENSPIGPVGQVIVGGFSPIGVDVFNFPQRRTNGTYQFADTARLLFNASGSHSLAFGTDIRRTFLSSDLPRNARSLLTFYGGQCTDVRTFCPRTAGYAQPLDYAASGASTGFFQSLISPGSDSSIRLSYYQLNFFAQDEWRIARNLTINAGLRYELNTTPKEADSKIEKTFSQSLPSYLSGLSQFIDGRTSIYDSDRNNFAPRVGFAYAPTTNTAIRGGFGVFYDQILGAVVSQSRNVYPTFTNLNFGSGGLAVNGVSSDPNVPRAFSIFNPRNAIFDPSSGRVCNFADILAGVSVPCRDPRTGGSIFLIQPGTMNTVNPALSQQQLQTALGDIYAAFPAGSLFGTTLPTRTLDAPFSYQYSLGVEQRIFKNTFVSAAYVGTTGRHLLRFTSPNLGGNFVTRISGFFYNSQGCNSDSTSTALCVPQALGSTAGFAPRPVQNAGAISQFETTGRSQYHSLQLEVRGRFSTRLQYRANYVFGKVNDDVSDVFDLAGAFALPQDSVTFAGEYAPANFDVRHRFAYTFLLDTPKLKDQNDYVRAVLGDWRIASTGRFYTGQPYTVNTTVDVNQDGNLTDRLNNTKYITETGDRSRPLILADNAVFREMLARFGQDGSVPRNSFRAGSVLDLDISFARRFAFAETQAIEVRADVFNFINRANFGIPVRFLESPGFGRATDTITPGRRVQIVLRYFF